MIPERGWGVRDEKGAVRDGAALGAGKRNGGVGLQLAKHLADDVGRAIGHERRPLGVGRYRTEVRERRWLG